jgi:RNA polymerase sigma-70 factor (ECF subfamily)
VAASETFENDGPAEERLARTEQLLAEHQAEVFRYAYRLSGCVSTAEDITQEVFLRAFRSLHQLRETDAARGWLLVIARNEFVRWCRKSAASGVAVDSQECELSDESDEPLVDRQEWVEVALRQLPEEFRLVLLMFYFEELSYAEIAEQLKIPMGTVMSRLSRGRAHLKAALEKGNSKVV